ncbi:MAG TPA: aldo/keto reductase [Verrucomicrobiae bacterium]|nr:aldo/keto reductase [Verrucomicrobiae bacterium]
MQPCQIEIRPCGTAALKLPALGMGCWAFGGGEYWGPRSQNDVDQLTRRALDFGCNYFDTAESYNGGASEESLGRALKGIPRDQVTIGTKISPSNTAPKSLVTHCEASLRRLQTSYIDIYMVHWPITLSAIRHFNGDEVNAPNALEVFAKLDQLRREGKIRCIGVSNFGRGRLEEALSAGVEIAVNELPYSLLTRAIEIDILPYCRSKGIGVIGYMALMQGVLSDVYSALADVPMWRRRTRHFDSQLTPNCRHGLNGVQRETEAALAAIRCIAKKCRMTTAEIALKWALANSNLASSLCGSRNINQLEMNIKAASIPLDSEVVEQLNRATQSLLVKLGPSFDYYESPENDRTR